MGYLELQLQGQQDRTEYQGHKDNQSHQGYQGYLGHYRPTSPIRTRGPPGLSGPSGLSGLPGPPQAHQGYQDTRAIRIPGLRSAIRGFKPEFSPVLWMFDINIIAIEY